MKLTRILAALLALLMLVGTLAACGGPVEEPDTTAPDGTKILCTVWLERETGAPNYAEFSTDGVVLLTARTLSFDMT